MFFWKLKFFLKASQHFPELHNCPSTYAQPPAVSFSWLDTMMILVHRNIWIQLSDREHYQNIRSMGLSMWKDGWLEHAFKKMRENPKIHINSFILLCKWYLLNADGVVKKFRRCFVRFFISRAFSTLLLNSYSKNLH